MQTYNEIAPRYLRKHADWADVSRPNNICIKGAMMKVIMKWLDYI